MTNIPTTGDSGNDAFSRREFLAFSGTVAAATSLSTSVVAADESGSNGAPHKLLKAVKFGMISGHAPVVEKFKLLKQAGFDGVDIDRHVDPEEVRQAKEQTGIIVHGVVGYEHWGKPLSDPDPSVRKRGRESFIGTLRDCKAYGGTTALLVPGKVTKQVPYADAYKRSQDEVRKLLPVAEELQVVICIENVWNDMLYSPLEMARYVDELNSPWCGQYFDVGNCVKYGWPEHWIAVLGKRIKKVDIKEFSRSLMNTKGPGAGFKLKIGEPGGDCDWPAVIQALQAIGYNGWATAEVPGGGLEELKDISQRMDRAFSSAAT